MKTLEANTSLAHRERHVFVHVVWNTSNVTAMSTECGNDEMRIVPSQVVKHHGNEKRWNAKLRSSYESILKVAF